LVLLTMLLSTVTACSITSGKSVIRSETHLQTEKLLERGLRAQQKSDLRQAEQLFADALALSSSIEDNPDRVIALVNLARLNRLGGKIDASNLYIDQALQICSAHPEFTSEVTYEKALVEIALKNNTDALKWASRALDAENGPSKGVRRNLLARTQLINGNLDTASKTATIALQENRNNDLPEEEANSLRMLGDIELKSRRLESAEKLLLEALEIDKRIGASAKIGLDLEKLAEVAERKNEPVQNADYLERACSVHLSAGRRDKAVVILQDLIKVYQKNGDTRAAEKAKSALEQLVSKTAPYTSSISEIANPSSKP